MDVGEANRAAWDRQVDAGNPWTVPVTRETVARARSGEWRVFLTPTRPVPAQWLGNVKGRRILCLASGGGQQGPLLAAAGALVTVLDNSPRQLQQDRGVAQREGLSLETVEGTMKDLSVFAGESFDLIVHPVSNCYVDDVRPVWTEAARVLRAGGALLSGFNNPAVYLFDGELLRTAGTLVVKHPLPFSDLEALDEQALRERAARGSPLEFSHTLELLIGGQMEAGLVMSGFYEDHNRPGETEPIDRYLCPYIATRSITPHGEAV